MKVLANTILLMVDRFITKVGPFNALINRIVVLIAPKTAAMACSGYLCLIQCEWHTGTACYNTLGCPDNVYYYTAGPPQCESGAYNCIWIDGGSCCGGGYCG